MTPRRAPPRPPLLLRDGKIVSWRPPAGATVIDLAGHTILPGLIDAHVHLTLGGNPDSNAAATLRAGFITVADLGSANGAGVRLRDAIAAGQVDAPRVIAADSCERPVLVVKGGRSATVFYDGIRLASHGLHRAAKPGRRGPHWATASNMQQKAEQG